MAAENFAYMTFPGIQQVERASFTLSHGVTASSASLEILPQANFTALVGPLAIIWNGETRVFPDCRIDTTSFRYNQSGQIWQLRILDRRWKWGYGWISGHYNQRFQTLQPLQSIDFYTMKSPQQLCALCLEAMGERDYDVSQVPDDARPEVNWEISNPAQMLADLAEKMGCRVVLRLNNTVMIARAGVGSYLPEDGVEADALSFHIPARPDKIMATGGPSCFQMDFFLEAVAEDTDGTVRPIAELSYLPKGEVWGQSAGFGPPDFSAVPGYEVPLGTPPPVQYKWLQWGPNPRQLAKDGVFRWYRISMKGVDDETKTPLIPGWGEGKGQRIQERWQILPCKDVQVEGFFDAEKVFHPLPAQVWGRAAQGSFWGGVGIATTADEDGNSLPGQFIDVSFSVDTERGIIKFSDYVWKWAQDPADAEKMAVPGFVPSQVMVPADLWVRLAVNVKDFATGGLTRYSREYTFPDQYGTPPRVIPVDEAVLSVVPKYNTDYTVQDLTTTRDWVDPELDYAIQAALFDYQVTTPQDRTYMGIRWIDLDGAVQQVTWEMDGQEGASTRASRGTEWNPAVVPYRERRMIERTGSLLKTAPRLLSRVRGGG